MARLKSEANQYVTIKETEYLELVENKMVVEALIIAGVEELPIYQAVQRILQDGRVQIHKSPLCKRYRFGK